MRYFSLLVLVVTLVWSMRLPAEPANDGQVEGELLVPERVQIKATNSTFCTISRS